MAKTTIMQPQSQAGILGISSNTNMGGLKFGPQGFVLLSILFVILIKVLDKIVS